MKRKIAKLFTDQKWSSSYSGNSKILFVHATNVGKALTMIKSIREEHKPSFQIKIG